MVKIIIFKDKDTVTRVRSSGHSGYADAGSDIVCAAISILMINTVNSIETFTDDIFSCIAEEKKAVMDIQLDKKPSEGAVLLIKSLALGLEAIADTYGSQFVRIEYKSN